MTERPDTPIAVFDADSPPTLAAVRSLGRAGYPVAVYSSSKSTVAGASRFARYRRWCPSPFDHDAFLSWLKDTVRSGEIDIVVPTSDLSTYYISEVLDLFREDVRRLYPSREQLRSVLLKDVFDAGADEGVRVPAVFAPRSVDELRERAPDLEYPVVVKPRSHIATPDDRGFIARSPSELLRGYAPLTCAAGMKSLVDDMPELLLPVVQEFVDVDPREMLTVSGVLAPDGAVLSLLGAKKTGQWPPEMGIGLMFEDAPVDDMAPELVDFVRRHLSRGIFELEVIPRPGGGYWALDLNPRAFGQIRFDIARGADLPTLWLSGLYPTPEPARPAKGSSLRFAYTVPLTIKSLVDATVAGDGHALDALKLIRSPEVMDIVHDPDDAAPTAEFLKSLLRHPRALVRHFYRDAAAHRG